MERIYLPSYNVEEMSISEINNTNGGIVWFAIPAVVKGAIWVIGAICAANAVYNFVEGAVDGYTEAVATQESGV